ncbi:hypothetical protein Tco_0375860 [Tanacetum coccineum]
MGHQELTEPPRRLHPTPEAPPSTDFRAWPGGTTSPIYIPYVPLSQSTPEFIGPPEIMSFQLRAAVLTAVVSPTRDDDEEDEEEEHLASADSTVVALPAVDRTDSIFFISYSPFPQTPSPPPPQILSPPISPTRIEIPESCLPPRKRPRLASPTPIYEVGETSAGQASAG